MSTDLTLYLQGIRLSKVSGHGIFIVDGKKIVK